MSTPKKAHAVTYRGFHRVVPEARLPQDIAATAIQDEHQHAATERYRRIGFLFSSLGNVKHGTGSRARKAEAIYKRTGVWVQ